MTKSFTFITKSISSSNVFTAGDAWDVGVDNVIWNVK